MQRWPPMYGKLRALPNWGVSQGAASCEGPEKHWGVGEAVSEQNLLSMWPYLRALLSRTEQTGTSTVPTTPFPSQCLWVIPG